jgi:hypothetical protein
VLASSGSLGTRHHIQLASLWRWNIGTVEYWNNAENKTTAGYFAF